MPSPTVSRPTTRKPEKGKPENLTPRSTGSASDVKPFDAKKASVKTDDSAPTDPLLNSTDEPPLEESTNTKGKMSKTQSLYVKRRHSFATGSVSSGVSAFFTAFDKDVACRPFVSDLTYRNVHFDELTQDSTFMPWVDDVALAFVDISGYSQLARLAAHDLASSVNSYFERLLAIVEMHHGFVLKFAGDAFIVLWHGPDSASACCAAMRCSMAMQSDAGEHAPPALEGKTLGIHIGVTFGRVETEVYCPRAAAAQLKSGGKSNLQSAFYFVGGPVLADVAAPVDASKRGETCVSKAVIDTVRGDPDCANIKLELVEPTVSGFDGVQRLVSMGPLPEEMDEAIEMNVVDEETAAEERDATIDEQFIAPAIVQGLKLGLRPGDMAELRNLCVLFIKKASIVDTATWFDEVVGVLAAHNAGITQVIDDDKGTHVVAALNLFVTEDGAADSTVAMARELEDSGIGCITGAACGRCFCGIAGSAKHSRWDITGMPCIRACRLMQHAEKVGVSVCIDMSIAETITDKAALRMFDPEVSMKGLAHPVPVFVTAEPDPFGLNLLAAINEYSQEVRLTERNQLKAHLEATGGVRMSAAIVSGPPSAGKKTLLLSLLHELGITPFFHRSQRGASRLSLCESLGMWFKQNPNERLKKLAEDLLRYRSGRATGALSLALELLDAIIDEGEQYAIVVDRAQYLDDSNIRMLTRAMERCAERASPPQSGSGDGSSASTAATSSAVAKNGRVIFCFSLTPLLIGTSPQHLLRTLPQTSPSLSTTIHVSLNKATAHDVVEAVRNFTGFSVFPPHAQRLVERGVTTPQNALEYVKLNVGTYVERFMEAQGKEDPGAEHGWCPTERHGAMELNDHIMQVAFRETSTIDITETVSSIAAVIDTLHPRHHVLTKAVACLVTGGKSIRASVALSVAQGFLRGTSHSTLQRDLKSLEQLHVLTLEEPSDEHDPDSALCRPHSRIVAELVRATLTPLQLQTVATKGLEALSKSSERPSTPDDHLHLAHLFDLAKQPAETLQHLKCAWEAHTGSVTEAPPDVFLLEWIPTRIVHAAKDFGIDVAAIAAPHVHNGAVPCEISPRSCAKFLFIGVPVERTKNFEPPLSLGPYCGIIGRVARRLVFHAFNALKAPPPESADIDLEASLDFIEFFSETIASSYKGDEAGSMSLKDELALVRQAYSGDGCRGDIEAIREVAERFMTYAENVVVPRSNVATKFANDVRAVKGSDDTPDTRARRGLLAAATLLADVTLENADSDSSGRLARESIITLGVHGWTSPYPYLTPAKLRDAVLFHWISALEVKAIVLLFLLEGERGAVQIERRTCFTRNNLSK